MTVALTMIDGSAVRCRGCGRMFGVTCVVFPADYVYVAPTFPFAENDCPVCYLHDLVPEYQQQTMQLDLVLDDLRDAVGRSSEPATIRAYKRLMEFQREGSVTLPEARVAVPQVGNLCVMQTVGANAVPPPIWAVMATPICRGCDNPVNLSCESGDAAPCRDELGDLFHVVCLRDRSSSGE